MPPLYLHVLPALLQLHFELVTFEYTPQKTTAEFVLLVQLQHGNFQLALVDRVFGLFCVRVLLVLLLRQEVETLK